MLNLGAKLEQGRDKRNKSSSGVKVKNNSLRTHHSPSLFTLQEVNKAFLQHRCLLCLLAKLSLVLKSTLQAIDNIRRRKCNALYIFGTEFSNATGE